jgi:tetratricopeptide (TPR) repeat protein
VIKLFHGPSFLGTLTLVGVAIIVLFVADTFLARLEQSESQVQADHLFREGQDLLDRGENRQAIEKFKEAIVIERGNHQYRLALAEAQMAAGKDADAQETLNDLLQADPGDGRTALLMARVLLKEGKTAQAIAYYHRAIYGQWQPEPAKSRLAARFELVDLLGREDGKQDLLAELLPLEDQAPHDVATRLRIGRLLLIAGSPARAAEVFREVLHDQPSNAAALGELGEAEFAQGRYQNAQRHLQAALHLSPSDALAKRYLDLCDELLYLDPTIRGLSPADRYKRSQKLLTMVLHETNQCIGANPAAYIQDLIDRASRSVAAHVKPVSDAEVAETNLDLAEQLWQARRRQCKTPPVPDSPLALVLARVAP